MDEDNLSSSNFSKKSKNSDIEISDDIEEEIELSPVETIVWDCCEVNDINNTKEILYLYHIRNEAGFDKSIAELRKFVDKEHGNKPHTIMKWNSHTRTYKILVGQIYQCNTFCQRLFYDKSI